MRAAIEAAERREAGQAATADATNRATPGDASHADTAGAAPADDGKLRPEREMGRSAGPAGAGPADATGHATVDPLSHEPDG